MNSAWLCYNGTAAGLTRWECMHLPLGMVNDQITCCRISRGLAKEVKGGKQGAPAQKSVHERFFNS